MDAFGRYIEGMGIPRLPAVFDQKFRVSSVAFINRNDCNHSGKIFLPPSALDLLTRLNTSYPMLFELSGNTGVKTNAGVLEFTAEEGRCHVPYWMLQHLGIEENSIIRVRSVTLALGKFVKLQPHRKAFLDISNPKAVLENALRSFSALTEGDTFTIDYNDTIYEMSVLEVKGKFWNKKLEVFVEMPEETAVTIVETDIEVDFAPPLDYEEPEPQAAAAASSSTVATGETAAAAGQKAAQAEEKPAMTPEEAKKAYWDQLSQSSQGRSIRSASKGDVSAGGATSSAGVGPDPLVSSAPVTAASRSSSSALASSSGASLSQSQGGAQRKKEKKKRVHPALKGQEWSAFSGKGRSVGK